MLCLGRGRWPVSPESYTDPNLPKGRKGRNDRYLTSPKRGSFSKKITSLEMYAVALLLAWETSISGAFKRGLMRQRASPKCRCVLCLALRSTVRKTTKLLLTTACSVIALVLFWCVDGRLGKYRASVVTNHRFNLYNTDLFTTSIFAPQCSKAMTSQKYSFGNYGICWDILKEQHLKGLLAKQ